MNKTIDVKRIKEEIMQLATDTRNEAYQDIQKTITTSRRIVYEIIKSHKEGLTNSEIAAILNVPINRVTGRVFELRELGLVADGGKRICNITNKQCHIWKDNHG